MTSGTPKHVLDGYKVLDFTQVLAGPTVSRLMAEMGPEIIKVELMPTGDFGWMLPFLKDGGSAYHIQQNRGKKSLCIDAKSPKGKEILRGLIEKVDIPGMPLRFSEFPEELPLEAPFLGEHHEEILFRYLGYSSEQVREMEGQGMLKREAQG